MYYYIAVNEFDLILNSDKNYTCNQIKDIIKEYRNIELEFEKEVNELFYSGEKEKTDKFEKLVQNLDKCNLLDFLKSKDIYCINEKDYGKIQFFERKLDIYCNNYKGDKMENGTCCQNPQNCTGQNPQNCENQSPFNSTEQPMNTFDYEVQINEKVYKGRINLVRVGVAVLVVAAVLFAGFYFNCPLLSFRP